MMIEQVHQIALAEVRALYIILRTLKRQDSSAPVTIFVCSRNYQVRQRES